MTIRLAGRLRGGTVQVGAFWPIKVNSTKSARFRGSRKQLNDFLRLGDAAARMRTARRTPMSITQPGDSRLDQEQHFLGAITAVEQGVFTAANAAAFAVASDRVLAQIKSGFDVTQGFRTSAVADYTPLGLYNMLGKDLILVDGEPRPDGMSLRDVKVANDLIVKAYKSVLSASADIFGTLRMHMVDGDAEMDELSSMVGLRDVSDADLLARCLDGGITFDPEPLLELPHSVLVGLAGTPRLLREFQASPPSGPLLARFNDINALIMATPDELGAHLLGPSRVLLRAERLNHGFHCAIAAHAPAEKVEIWLKGGASLDGSVSPQFTQSLLGSAIVASAKVDRLAPDDEQLSEQPSGEPDVDAPRCVVELLLEAGADVNSQKGALSPLAEAYAKGSSALVDLLLEHGATFRSREEHIDSMLAAAAIGADALVARCVEDGVPIEATVTRSSRSTSTGALLRNEHSALSMASMFGKGHVVALCLELGSNPERLLHRETAGPQDDVIEDVNFLQDALRVDHPEVLEAAIRVLGFDRVNREPIPRSARKSRGYLQAVVAAWAVGEKSGKGPTP